MYYYQFGVPDPSKLEHLSEDTPCRETAGGKGIGLIEMSSLGVSVPPGIIIPTKFSVEGDGLVVELGSIVESACREIAAQISEDGLALFSVRSGARVSMPGMMDTILNVGMTDDNLDDWVQKVGVDLACNNYRRLIEMTFNSLNPDLSPDWQGLIDKVLQYKYGMDSAPTCIEEASLKHHARILKEYKSLFSSAFGFHFPNSLKSQLRLAIHLVFKSWNSPRAKHYRAMCGFSDDWGTAVTIQSMVFGNAGEDSCSGVVFSRNPNTGEAKLFGEYLPNCQGEDVVAGTSTPLSISSLPEWNKDVSEALSLEVSRLESHYKDMQDIEFTVQRGELFILQTRAGKRAGLASYVIASDLVDEGVLSMEEAKSLVSYREYKELSSPKISPEFSDLSDAVGIGASGGIATGVAVFSSEEAVACTEPCILIANETTPNDIKGMEAAVGILTKTGGMTSHAAVVARSLGKVCVVGCTDLVFSKNPDDKHPYGVESSPLTEVISGQTISIDGESGKVWFDLEVPVVTPEIPPRVAAFVEDIVSSSPGMVRIGVEEVSAFDLDFPVYVEACSIETVFYDGIESSLADLALRVKEGSVLSMAPETYNEEDSSLFNIFGIQPPPSRLDHVFKVLLESGKLEELKKVVSLHLHSPDVADLYQEKLRSAGWRVIPMVNDVATLISTNSLFVPTSHLVKSVGGDKIFADLQGILSEQLKDQEVLPAAYTINGRLSRALNSTT